MDTMDEDWAFTPTLVLVHRVAAVPRKRIKDGKLSVVRDKHVRVKTCWKNGEVSWVSMDSLQEQNPWVLLNYVIANGLQHNPHFQWIHPFLASKDVIANTAAPVNTSKHNSQALKFKFGEEVPCNAAHALKLDELHKDHKWQEAMDKEFDSINSFKTFRVLEKGEEMPEGCTRIPYHIVFDVKFDGCFKARLVAGGHRTPDVDHEETYSGVVGMDMV